MENRTSERSAMLEEIRNLPADTHIEVECTDLIAGRPVKTTGYHRGINYRKDFCKLVIGEYPTTSDEQGAVEEIIMCRIRSYSILEQ